MLLTLTESAKLHFINLIKSQPKKLTAKDQQLNLRIQAIFPGTLKANVKLSYCPFGGQKSSDIAIDCGNFIVYIEKKSEQALKNAIIDYREEPGAKGIGKLHIKAPYLKERHDLFSKIDFFLDTKINPSLKMHGGIVKLIEINEVNGEVVLQFGGGCKGCSMVDFTLNNSIEKSLKAEFPEIKVIKDATIHTDAKNPFYT